MLRWLEGVLGNAFLRENTAQRALPWKEGGDIQLITGSNGFNGKWNFAVTVAKHCLSCFTGAMTICLNNSVILDNYRTAKLSYYKLKQEN